MKLNRFLTLNIRFRRRHRAAKGLFVISDTMPGFYQIDDISTGGLSYHYVSNGALPKKGIYGLNIVSKDNSVSLALLGRTVSDRETGSIVIDNATVKRRSIRFERLMSTQKNMLREIIKNYTVTRKPSYWSG